MRRFTTKCRTKLRILHRTINSPLPLGEGRISMRRMSIRNTGEGQTKKQAAFTLAEVLITLAIIGVVAALTIPTLMVKYQKHETETKLRKFYSTFQQALKLAEAENGDIKGWAPDGTVNFETWYNEYLDNHIESLDKRAYGESQANYGITLKDGSFIYAYNLSPLGAYIPLFYCTRSTTCIKELESDQVYDGKTSFLFQLKFDNTNNYFYAWNYYNDLDEVTLHSDEWRKLVLKYCKEGAPDTDDPKKRHFCSTLIQFDGWKIKDDYPWEFTGKAE